MTNFTRNADLVDDREFATVLRFRFPPLRCEVCRATENLRGGVAIASLNCCEPTMDLCRSCVLSAVADERLNPNGDPNEPDIPNRKCQGCGKRRKRTLRALLEADTTGDVCVDCREWVVDNMDRCVSLLGGPRQS